MLKNSRGLQLNSVISKLFKSLQLLSWPADLGANEDHFNRTRLFNLLNQLDGLGSIQVINESNRIRRQNATPFFGWGKNKLSNTISGHLKTDLLFSFGDHNFFVENKIITNRECDIKNSLIQGIEYLNVYHVSVGIVLIFDGGRGKEQEWEGGKEAVLINALTKAFPLCVVRVREQFNTKTYFSESTLP